MTWTQDDVEAITEATMLDRPIDPDVIARLGEDPGEAFMRALGRRMWEAMNPDETL